MDDMSQNNDVKLVLALPKGRILTKVLPVLARAGLEPEAAFFDSDDRRLSFGTNHENIDIIRVRSFDVATFLAYGAAHIAIAGSDVLMEFDHPEIYAPVDLGIGACRMVVASEAHLAETEDPRSWSHVRVATKYPNLTNDFLISKGVTQYKLISSLGATETYPFIGSSEIITDITSTGKTLSDNNLRILKDGLILKSTACLLIAKKKLTKVSLLLKEINDNKKFN